MKWSKRFVMAVLLATTAMPLVQAETVGAPAFFAEHQQQGMGHNPVNALRRTPELDAMTAAVVPTFTQHTYTDTVTGKIVPYNIYLPKDYDATKSYPLVLFIGDASTVGSDETRPLTQSGYGGIIWATPEEQAKHPAIVVVPQYPQVILDDHGQHVLTDYVELTGRLLQAVETTYHADRSRIYGTGQSMGCMTVMYLAARHPDLFTATLFVDGQWDIQSLEGLKSQRFIYVAAGGDDKASAGLREVKTMLDDAHIPYGYLPHMDAKENALVRNTEASLVLNQGYTQNFFTWKTGTVLPDNAPKQASEHMFSFNHAYQVTAFRDWLFAQHK